MDAPRPCYLNTLAAISKSRKAIIGIRRLGLDEKKKPGYRLVLPDGLVRLSRRLLSFEEKVHAREKNSLVGGCTWIPVKHGMLRILGSSVPSRSASLWACAMLSAPAAMRLPAELLPAGSGSCRARAAQWSLAKYLARQLLPLIVELARPQSVCVTELWRVQLRVSYTSHGWICPIRA